MNWIPLAVFTTILAAASAWSAYSGKRLKLTEDFKKIDQEGLVKNSILCFIVTAFVSCLFWGLAL